MLRVGALARACRPCERTYVSRVGPLYDLAASWRSTRLCRVGRTAGETHCWWSRAGVSALRGCCLFTRMLSEQLQPQSSGRCCCCALGRPPWRWSGCSLCSRAELASSSEQTCHVPSQNEGGACWSHSHASRVSPRVSCLRSVLSHALVLVTSVPRVLALADGREVADVQQIPLRASRVRLCLDL